MNGNWNPRSVDEIIDGSKKAHEASLALPTNKESLILTDSEYKALVKCIEHPCTACKKQVGEFESWNYCTPSGKIFGNLCAECAQHMVTVNFK